MTLDSQKRQRGGALNGAVVAASFASRATERGAVLVEVLLALALFAVTAAIVSSGMSASMDSVERQRLSAHAANLAITVLSEIQLGLREAVGGAAQDFDPPFDNWTWELEQEAVEADIGEASSLARVEVIIRHKQTPLVYRLAGLIEPARAASAAQETYEPGAF